MWTDWGMAHIFTFFTNGLFASYTAMHIKQTLPFLMSTITTEFGSQTRMFAAQRFIKHEEICAIL